MLYRHVFDKISTEFCVFLWILRLCDGAKYQKPWLWAASFTYTNWRLKICIWRLYFSSWLPKGDLTIFLISSPGRPLQKPTNMLPCQLLVWLWPNSATHRLAHLWHNSISTRLFAKSQPSYWRTSKPNAWSSEKFWLHVGWICTNFTYWHKLNFLDCLLSGRDWTSMICHKVQNTCLWLYAGKATPSNTKLTLPNGNSTVEKGTLKFLSLL